MNFLFTKKGSKRKASKANIPTSSATVAAATAQQQIPHNSHSLYSNEIINSKLLSSNNNNGEKRLIKIAKKKRTSLNNSNRNNHLTSTSADSSSHHEYTNEDDNDDQEDEEEYNDDQEDEEEYDDDDDDEERTSFKDSNGRSYSESHLSPQASNRERLQHLKTRIQNKQPDYRHTTIVMSQSTRTDLNYDMDEEHAATGVTSEDIMTNSASSDKSVSSSNIYDLYKVILEPNITNQVAAGGNEQQQQQRPRRHSDSSSQIDEIRVNDLINIDMELGAEHCRNENGDSIDNLMLSALSPPILLHSSSPNNTASLSTAAANSMNSLTPSSQYYSPDSSSKQHQEPGQLVKPSTNLLVLENIDERVVRTIITTTNITEESEFIEEPADFMTEEAAGQGAKTNSSIKPTSSNKNVEFFGLATAKSKIDGNFFLKIVLF
jgi:hypothetical protein